MHQVNDDSNYSDIAKENSLFPMHCPFNRRMVLWNHYSEQNLLSYYKKKYETYDLNYKSESCCTGCDRCSIGKPWSVLEEP
ncbi:MAG: hypothetical protein ACLUD0_20405 [Eubacterium ramulus]